MHKNALFPHKSFKNFLGTGHSPLPRPHPHWGGDTRPPYSRILDPPLHCTNQKPNLTLTFDLLAENGTPVTPAVGNAHANFDFSTPFGF